MKAAVRKLQIPGDDPVFANLNQHASRDEWLAARKNGIGGSEVAIIMGASKWGSPYKLWASKTGLIDDRRDDTEILEFGRLVEPLIAKKYAEKTGRKLINLGEFTTRRNPSYPWLQVTHDYMIADGVQGKNGPGVLSIKTVMPWGEDEWMDGEAPLKYEIQLQAELLASECSWGSYAFLAWGQPVQWFDTNRNDEFLKVMETDCSEFWRCVTEQLEPPVDGSEHTKAALGLISPQEVVGKVVDLPTEAWDWTLELERIAEQTKAGEEKTEELKNKLRQAIGDAEAGQVPDGGPIWTYKRQVREASTKVVTVEASSWRVLRRKKEPKKKESKK